jgi:uncharacterized membrane protein
MEEKETNRLEAFSDGVFAVAITLLVLNIKIPGIDLPPGKLPLGTDFGTHCVISGRCWLPL